MASKLALALLLTGSVASATEPAFDSGVKARPVLEKAKRSSVAVPSAEPAERSVFVTLSQADLAVSGWEGLDLGQPVVTGQRAMVFRVPERSLARIAEFMHEKFQRCGGFFAHDSKAEAEATLEPRARVTSFDYTLDSQARVLPIVAEVKEAELRSTIETLSAYHNRYYQAETGVAAARWIKERWSQLSKGLPGASAELVTHAGWKQPSVVLTIPGAEKPEEVVVLGGHLDSISGYWGGEKARAPGADDNASGIAVLTEAIRVLAQAGVRPKRTIQFMGYAAEEVGLRGSGQLAKKYAAEGKKVVGVIQFDMTNFKGSPEEVFLLTDNVDPALTAFLGKLLDAYGGVKWSTTKCGYGCSDHASWTQNGFAASAAFESAFETMNKALHTERDTLSTMGGAAAHSVPFAKLAAAFAVELAKWSPAGGSAAR